MNNIGTKATNIARLLQTLDNNSSNGAKLLIPITLRDLNVSNVNLELDGDLGTILTQAQNLTSTAYTLKDSNSARNEMKRYIGLYNEYDSLKAGYYTGTTTKYYLLTMPSSGNIIIDTNWNYSHLATYIYDINLNEVNYFDDDNLVEIGKSTNLVAGTYIIKVSYPDYGGIMTVNSPILFNQNNLPTISNGNFIGNTTKYYLLTMPSSGNIIIDTNWNYSHLATYIYDINLNEVNYFDDDNLVEIGKSTNLVAGTYIIKVSYPDYGGTMTVNSQILN